MTGYTMTQNKGVTEWNDPYPIVDTEETPSIPDDRKRAILRAITTAYEQQHTTTPLDADASFRLEQLTPVDDSPATEYEFEVHRFIGGTPAKRYTGHVHRTDDGWEVTYENQSLGNGFWESIRSVLPHTSSE